MLRGLHCLGQRCRTNLLFAACRNMSSKTFTLDDVGCFGSLIVECPHDFASIETIDPHNVPNGDKAYVNIESPDDSVDVSKYCNVEYENAMSVIKISSQNKHIIIEKNHEIKINIKIPHNYSIDAEASEIDLGENEGDDIKLLSYRNCFVGKIKSTNTFIKAFGHFKCKEFQGNGLISADGDINIRKIQSNDVFLRSKQDVNISAVYSQSFGCETNTGNINIRSLHGVSKLTSDSGLINVDSSSGDLEISTKSGSINVSIENTNKADISSVMADIHVGFGDNVSTCIDAEAGFINVPADFLIDGVKKKVSNGREYFEGKLGDGKSSVLVNSENGLIAFSRKNWFSKFEKLDD